MKIRKIKKPYKLHNDGNLELTFIGTGTAFSKKLNNNNFIIVKGNTHLLVDFGITGPKALQDVLGIDVSEIENLIVTHSHSDHIGGLEYLSLNNRYIAQPIENKSKLKLIINERFAINLWKHSLIGGMESNESIDSIKKLYLTDYFEICNPTLIATMPREIYKINFFGINIEIFATKHVSNILSLKLDNFNSYGLFIDDRILISGDTKFDKELLDYYFERSEVIFHDCSFVQNPVHCSLEELKTLPDDYKAKIILMHYGDNWKDFDTTEFKGLAKQGYSYSFQ
jgi:hydroxyacylglutathione hydrolase